MGIAHERSVSSALDQFIEEVRSAWGGGKDPSLPFKVTALMERFIAASRPNEACLARLIQEARPGRELYRDPEHGFALVGHVHKTGHHSPPHDHGSCWVVYGVGRGAIEITTYRRTDDGRAPERATLEEKERVRLTPGVVRPYLAGEIHATRAIDPSPSLVFRFLSTDLDRVERYRYDLETGTATRHPGR